MMDWILWHLAIVAAAAAVVYASPLYELSVKAGDLAGNVNPYKIVCYAARAKVEGLDDCPEFREFEACYNRMDTILSCQNGMINGVSNRVKTDSFTVSITLAVIVASLGAGLLLSFIARWYRVLASVAVFVRLIAAISASVAILTLTQLQDYLRHGDDDSALQEVELGPSIVAAALAPLMSLALDAYQ